MNHPKLGSIEPNPDDPEHFFGKVSFQGRELDLDLTLDGSTLEEVTAIGSEIVAKLSKFNERAKEILVRDLRDTYNNGWNEYDEPQPDGSIKSVHNPELEPEEFRRKFTLTGIRICGDMVDLEYDDDGLFWGHYVSVSSMNGADFEDAKAEMAG